MQVLDYKVVCVKDADNFQQKVKTLLDLGWELYGSPMSPEINLYFQALVMRRGTGDERSEVAYVEGGSIGEITLKVEERLEEEWKPVGGLTVTEFAGNPRFYQMMSRTTKVRADTVNE